MGWPGIVVAEWDRCVSTNEQRSGVTDALQATCVIVGLYLQVLGRKAVREFASGIENPSL